jgi:DNA processing protein
MKSSLFWLKLIHTPGVGLSQGRSLLENWGEDHPPARRDSQVLARCGWDKRTIQAYLELDDKALAPDLDWLARPGHHLLGLDDPRYPGLLARLDDAPLALYVTGEPDLLQAPQIAVVGSRNPTEGGLANAREFARFMASQGIVVTSGLAQGIDCAAHQGAMEGGTTIAVTGTGLDIIYPESSRGIAEAIAEQGAIVSEFSPGTPPRRENFPRRNRVISGLSLGTLVVEATRRSGSLITARLASEQGREVFAIPGSIHNPMARGCHQLIRQGAKLVESAQDIFEELGPLAAAQLRNTKPVPPRPVAAKAAEAGRDPEYARLLQALGHDPVSQDELARRTGLTAAELSSMLLILELEGEVTLGHGGNYQRAVKEADK